MGKNKLAKWAELNTFKNVIQPVTGDVAGKDHEIKGNWRKEVFKNNNPIVLELGCGKGEYTTELSGLFPKKNFIGIDIKGARIWRGAKTASENQSGNVAFLRTRIEFIDSFFSDNEADEILLIFPDPHPGKRNSNKRLTSPWFLNKYRTILKDNGIVHLKTDNRELYDFTMNRVAEMNLEILFFTDDLHALDEAGKKAFASIYMDNTANADNEKVADSVTSIRTHYEKIFIKEGLTICYIAFRLTKNKITRDGREKTN